MEREAYQPPSRMLFFLEGGRAIARLGSYMTRLPELRKLQKGDGHPVMVLPGFMAGDFSTVPLRSFLRKQGYEALPWGLGVNTARDEFEHIIPQIICDHFKKYGRKISLIGWSLGGVYAREAARIHPELIRQVITLGSPFNGINRVSSVSWVYERIRGKKISDLDPELVDRLSKPIDVPVTNIFSKTDGVVSWQCCVEQSEGPNRENIEVNGSHIGLGHNPEVLRIIADRLSQPKNKWNPFDPHPLKQF
ncbi:MAG: alpha/beta hydrolase [Bacteroidota bacterium]